MTPMTIQEGSWLDGYAQKSVAAHPLFQRLEREPFNRRSLFLIFANVREGAGDFVPWLASLTARVDDMRARSVLARQLNDELGCGDFARIHSVLFDQLIAGIEPWRPSSFPAELLAPGRRLASKLAALFLDPDPFIGLGAAMISEIYAQMFDQRVAEEIRRQRELPHGVFEWLAVHEQLEVGHADDARVLASLIPRSPAPQAAVREGARRAWEAFEGFLDGLEPVCS